MGEDGAPQRTHTGEALEHRRRRSFTPSRIPLLLHDYTRPSAPLSTRVLVALKPATPPSTHVLVALKPMTPPSTHAQPTPTPTTPPSTRALAAPKPATPPSTHAQPTPTPTTPPSIRAQPTPTPTTPPSTRAQPTPKPMTPPSTRSQASMKPLAPPIATTGVFWAFLRDGGAYGFTRPALPSDSGAVGFKVQPLMHTLPAAPHQEDPTPSTHNTRST